MSSEAATALVDELTDLRRELLLNVLQPTGGRVGLVHTQLRVVVAIGRAERARRELHRRDPLRHELKWAIVQLRVLGDTIAWLALDAHAIRNLAKAPSASSASISGQHSGLTIVARRAVELAELGHVVVIADATNAIRTGDLVSLAPDRTVVVTECKASLSTARSPRGRRQARRAELIADYLRSGYAHDPSFGIADWPVHGPPGSPLASIDGLSLETDVVALRAALQQAEAEGFAVSVCGPTEMIIVGNPAAPPSDLREMIQPQSPGDALIVGYSSDVVNAPSPLLRPVTLWDVPLGHRLLLWEKQLIVSHLVATSAFIGLDSHDPALSITDCDSDRRLRIQGRGWDVWLGPSIVDNVLYQWETPASARNRVFDAVRRMDTAGDPDDLTSGGLLTRFEVFVPEDEHVELSTGDKGNRPPQDHPR